MTNTLNSTPIWYGNPDGTCASFSVEKWILHIRSVKRYGGDQFIGISSTEGISYMASALQRQQRLVEWKIEETCPDFGGIGFMGCMFYESALSTGPLMGRDTASEHQRHLERDRHSRYFNGWTALQLHLTGNLHRSLRHPGQHADFRGRAAVHLRRVEYRILADDRAGVLLRRSPESGVQLQLSGCVHRQPRFEHELYHAQKE